MTAIFGLITAGDLRAEVDVVILACKAYDFASAIESIRPGLSPRGCVLPLLNGIGHLAILNEHFVRHRVLGGLPKIAIFKER